MASSSAGVADGIGWPRLEAGVVHLPQKGSRQAAEDLGLFVAEDDFKAAEDIDLKQTGYVLFEGSTIEGDMFEGIGDIRIVKR